MTELYQITGDKENIIKQNENRDFGAVEEAKSCGIDFNPYMVDLTDFPYNAWKKGNRSVWLEPEEMFRSGNKKGELRLRREIAKYLHQARGVECSVEQIIVGAGNE